MIVVVSDTSPLNYLAAIGMVGVLPKLFARIVIPTAVLNELMHPAAPVETRELVVHRPDWLEVIEVDRNRVQSIRATAVGLGAGEIEAICLAIDLKAVYLLTDDLDARRQAEARYGIRVTGTLGVLDLAAARSLIDLKEAIARLRATNLRFPEGAVDNLLRKDAERTRREFPPK